MGMPGPFELIIILIVISPIIVGIWLVFRFFLKTKRRLRAANQVNRNSLVKELLSKSGVIKVAALVELWTKWKYYVDSSTDSPTFRELYGTDPQTIAEAITRKEKQFTKLLQSWSVENKPTNFLEIEEIDNELVEQRNIGPLWMEVLLLVVFWPFCFFIGLWAILACKEIIATPLELLIFNEYFFGELVHSHGPDLEKLAKSVANIPAAIGAYIWIGYCLKKLISWIVSRVRYGATSRRALSVLKSVRKGLLRNLKSWSHDDLQDLMLLASALPDLRQEFSTKYSDRKQGGKAGNIQEQDYSHGSRSAESDRAFQEATRNGPNSHQGGRVQSNPPQVTIAKTLQDSVTEPARAEQKKSVRRINAKAVVQDIKSGMGETELMAKYRLSADQLDRLYGKLRESGVIHG